MKATELTLRGVNVGQTIECEEGVILITDKKSGFGSGRHTVASGSIKYANGNTATFENATIWGIKALFGIKCGGSGSNGRKSSNIYEKIAKALHVLMREINEDEHLYSMLFDAKSCANKEAERIKKQQEEEEAAEKARKATAQALLKGGLTAAQLAQIKAILEAK